VYKDRRIGRRPLGFAAMVCVLALFRTSVQAQTLEMKDLSTLPPPDLNIQVVGGNPVNPKNWPATLIFRDRAGRGCSATVVGPKTVLTAAHCLEKGINATVTVRGITQKIVCTQHPDYPARNSADFALCLLTETRLPALPFETASLDKTVPQTAPKFFLLGYGCVRKGGTDRTFGALYGGWATLKYWDDLDVKTQGGGAVCSGDSGGAAFVFTNPAETRRVLVAVNSRGDDEEFSWLATVANSTFVDWATNWAHENKVTICGIEGQVEGCRD
jgi:hypothetical protein